MRLLIRTHRKLLLVMAVMLIGCTGAFAASDAKGKDWVDTSVLYMIDMFAGNTKYYISVALRLARLMLILMLLWNFIQMVVGTMEGRKVFIGSVTKWIFFLLALHLYPAFSLGLRKLALEMGAGASGTSVNGVTDALNDYMKELDSLVDAAKREDTATFTKKIQGAESAFNKYKKEYEEKKQTYEDALKKGFGKYSNTALQNLEELEWRMKDASTKVAQVKKEQADAISDNSSGAARTLAAIKSVLVKNGKSITSKYRIDVGLKDKDGKDTGLISPNAIFRIGTLAAQIMWEKEWTVIDTEIKENQSASSFLFRNSTLLNFPLYRLFDLLLCIVAIVGMIVVIAVCLIQYIMALVEYTITSSFAIVLLPCLLFDPLKDMAQKIIPTLFAQAVKLIFITMAMFFACYSFLQLGINISEQASGFDFNTFGYVIFTGLLTAAFCVFAPKWAQTLLTGQPQMSMGEFVAAASAAAGGAMAAGHAAAKGASTAKSGAQKGASAAVNGLGAGAAMLGAGSAAKQAAAAEGKGKVGQALAGLGGAAREGTSRFAGSMKEKAENFVRGGGKGGKGGMGFGGSSERSKAAAAGKDGDTDNTRDFARHQTKDDPMDQNSKKHKSGIGEYLRAQAQSGRKNQNARINKKKKGGDSNVKLTT